MTSSSARVLHHAFVFENGAPTGRATGGLSQLPARAQALEASRVALE
jgi:hypothetical protein